MENSHNKGEDFSGFIPSNLRYLRSKIGLNINALSELVGIDPIDLWQFEQDSFLLSSDTNKTSELVLLCDYFAIPLDQLVYHDFVDDPSLVSDCWFDELRKELKGDYTPNRKDFFAEVGKEHVMLTENANQLDILKSTLRNIHRLLKTNNDYFRLRAKGLIGKSDFFEP